MSKLDESLREKLNEVKPVIRSILLALGKRATEKTFRSEYYNTEGESFNKILYEFRLSFYQFLKSIPDVCRVWDDGCEIHVERVSTEGSSHMDDLTVVTKRRKRSKPIPARFRPNFGFNNFHRRPLPRPNPSYASHRSTIGYKNLFKTPTPPVNGLMSSFKPLPKLSTYTPKPPLQPSRPASVKFPAPARPVQSHNSSMSSLPLVHMNKPKIVFKAGAIQNKENVAVVENTKLNSYETESSSSSTWSVESPKASRIIKPPPEPETPKKVYKNPFDAYVESLKKLRDGKMEEMKKEIKNTIEAQVKVQVSKPTAAVNLLSSNRTLPLLPLKLRQKRIQTASDVFEIENFIIVKYSIVHPRLREIKCLIFVSVELIDVTSPSQFIFKYNLKELNVMLEEMGMFYKNLEESKHLCIHQLLPGMPVAVYDEDMWQRAEVLCICGSDAFVLFIDAGYRKYIEISNLRYLEKSFAASSRKSCRGSLVGAKPKNNDTLWSAAAIMKFMAKTKGEKMFAIIKGQKDGFFQLSLVDDAAKRTKISDHLIAVGVAEEDKTADLSGNAILV